MSVSEHMDGWEPYEGRWTVDAAQAMTGAPKCARGPIRDERHYVRVCRKLNSWLWDVDSRLLAVGYNHVPPTRWVHDELDRWIAAWQWFAPRPDKIGSCYNPLPEQAFKLWCRACRSRAWRRAWIVCRWALQVSERKRQPIMLSTSRDPKRVERDALLLVISPEAHHLYCQQWFRQRLARLASTLKRDEWFRLRWALREMFASVDNVPSRVEESDELWRRIHWWLVAPREEIAEAAPNVLAGWWCLHRQVPSQIKEIVKCLPRWALADVRAEHVETGEDAWSNAAHAVLQAYGWPRTPSINPCWLYHWDHPEIEEAIKAGPRPEAAATLVAWSFATGFADSVADLLNVCEAAQ